MAKRESRRQRRLQEYLRRHHHAWLFKVHGGPYQPAGLPDLIGCIPLVVGNRTVGVMFGFEVKEPDGEPSDLQLETLGDIAAAGGIAAVVLTANDIEDAIDYWLQRHHVDL